MLEAPGATYRSCRGAVLRDAPHTNWPGGSIRIAWSRRISKSRWPYSCLVALRARGRLAHGYFQPLRHLLVHSATIIQKLMNALSRRTNRRYIKRSQGKTFGIGQWRRHGRMVLL